MSWKMILPTPNESGLVISNATPIYFLVLIGQIELPQKPLGKGVVPLEAEAERTQIWKKYAQSLRTFAPVHPRRREFQGFTFL